MQYDNFRMSICVEACNIQFLLDLSSLSSTITANAVEFTRILKTSCFNIRAIFECEFI